MDQISKNKGTKIITKPIKIRKKPFNKIIIFCLSGLVIFTYLLYLFFNRSANINGLVVDNIDNNFALSDVNISLDNEPIKNTGLSGNFSINGIKPGKHTLGFNRPNYAQHQEEINLNPGEERKILVKLAVVTENTVKSQYKFPSYNLAGINPQNNSISVIDPLNKQEPVQIPTGSKPRDLLVIPEKSKIYVANFGDSTVSVIDLKSLKLTKQISFPDGSQITQLRVSPAKDLVYVLDSGSNKITSINTSSDEMLPYDTVFKWPVKDFIVEPNSGNFILLNGIRYRISNLQGSEIKTVDFKSTTSYSNAVYSKEKNKVLLISVGINIALYDLASDNETILFVKEKIADAVFSPAGDRLYLLFPGSVSIFETDSGQVLKENIPLKTGAATKITISPDGEKLFINSGSEISVFDTKNGIMLEEKLNTGLATDTLKTWSN